MRYVAILAALCACFAVFAPPVQAQDAPFDGLRPPAREGNVPRTRWAHQPGHVLWNRAANSALKTHGRPLVDLVPADIETWCPRYETASDRDRRAFWIGFLSALAKYESTYKPRAVGGGGKWYGLLQILPATARGYDCNVGTGEALKNGAANLSCAVRIMAVTVPRDGVIYGPGGRGVAADWGPMRSKAKRADMAGWLRRQTYCAPINAVRPQSRPRVLVASD
ncbi:transglycosylase SLT domain-containing protein [uncultured Tateyamaria sp.]|uniref:transglycosylase SLT domain-containing protein n=1 Tax=uncultured Tateyamaria sp. TaxID=455651 RepID=UPI00260D5ED1|nr:transglycosylase SLT domain-containing protein [uncultured Tateyamaria sp.]